MTRTNQRDSSTSGGKPALLPGRDLTAHSKEAGALVYLQEELGDARMRCDQLLRYVDKAVQLVEKSSHKDHFFEVAGDVIRGIPETVFKLHKALEAVALAANRIDYEEIKQDLRPEKVEELERVLKDVRVRQVQRRSQPMVNPASVVEQLNSLAKKAREGGHLDTEGLTTLIASLEAGAPKVAEDTGAKAALQLEAVAHALQNPPEGEMPSRYRLAQVLRKTLGEHVEVSSGVGLTPKEAVDHAPNIARVLVLGAKELRRGAEAFESGEDQLAWQCLSVTAGHISSTLHMAHQKQTTAQKLMQELLEIATTADAGKTAAQSDEKRSRFEEGKPADPTKHMDPEDAKAWKENTDEYGDKFKKEAAKPPEAAVEEVLAAVEALKKLARGSGNPKLLLFSALSDLALAVKKMGQDEMISNLLDRTATVVKSKWSVKELADAGKSEEKTAADDAKRSRFEEGKPADPTKHMDPEDAKAWKENTDEYGDKFKKEAGSKPSESAELELNTAIYGIKQLLRGTGNPKRTLYSIVSSLSSAASHMGQDERITNALWKAGQIINQSFSVADMRGYSDAEAVTASDDEKRSRFEEGKPADPTKDMDPEDAKAWKENTDKYEDKFKKEAAVEGNFPLLDRLVHAVAEAAKQLKHSVELVKKDPQKYQPQVHNIQTEVGSLETLLRVVQRKVFDVRSASEKHAGGRMIPAPSGNVVEEIMAWHGGQGSKLYSVGSRWYGGHPVDADDAEEAYDELERLKADHGALADFEDHLREFGVTPDSVKKRFDAVHKRELKEMEALLKKAGFNPKDAKKLQEEGMGPEELKQRLKRPAGATGSLEYTHNLTRKASEYGKQAIKVVPVSRPKNPKILEAIMEAAIGGEEIVERWQKRQTVPSTDLPELYDDLSKKKWVDRGLLAEFKKHLESYRLKVSSESSWKAV